MIAPRMLSTEAEIKDLLEGKDLEEVIRSEQDVRITWVVSAHDGEGSRGETVGIIASYISGDDETHDPDDREFLSLIAPGVGGCGFYRREIASIELLPLSPRKAYREMREMERSAGITPTD